MTRSCPIHWLIDIEKCWEVYFIILVFYVVSFQAQGWNFELVSASWTIANFVAFRHSLNIFLCPSLPNEGKSSFNENLPLYAPQSLLRNSIQYA